MSEPRRRGVGVERRRFVVPEVIQSSSIDCGPAALRAVLKGFDIDVSYERLRDACQTDVDGTSVDALEDMANQLGLAAEQIWLPVDHLTLSEPSPLPAMVVVQVPSGAAHIIVVWRRVGPLFQIMDPSSGRRWLTGAQLRSLAFVSQVEVPGRLWREWAGTDEFARAMGARLSRLHADPKLAAEALADEGPSALACLDAALRMVSDLVDAGALKAGAETGPLVASVYRAALAELAGPGESRTIPPTFFSALPVEGDDAPVQLKGAVLVRLRGLAPPTREAQAEVLSPRSVASLHHQAARPWSALIELLRRDGGLSLATIFGTCLAGASLALIEALLLRAFLGVGARLQSGGQLLSALLALVGFVLITAALEWWSLTAVRAAGRRVELRLRAELLTRVPSLDDLYFATRPPGDLAHRAHLVHPIRDVVALGARLMRVGFDLALTVGGLIWLYPQGALAVLGAGVLCLALPRLGFGLLVERDHRARVFAGTLAQFYLDALLGLMPVRAHGAERAVRWEHGSIVLEWSRASGERLKVAVGVELLQAVVMVGCAAGLIVAYGRRGTESSATLLFAYWALALPALGHELAFLWRQLSRHQNLLTRVLEPLAASSGATRAAVAASAEVPRSISQDITVVPTGAEPRELAAVASAHRPGASPAEQRAAGEVSEEATEVASAPRPQSPPPARRATMPSLDMRRRPRRSHSRELTVVPQGELHPAAPRSPTRRADTDEVTVLAPGAALAAAAANPATAPSPRPSGAAPAVAVAFANVTIRATGKEVLSGVTLRLEPGEHVAVVGASGAGKSSLIGALLGWRRPDQGALLVDGRPLEGAHLEWLRGQVAWVDPAVTLWNRSLLDNISYGNHAASLHLGSLLEQSDLIELLRRLPDGLQTSLGEGGGLVSGGEGQRVRLARGLGRPNAALVLLDEPFRGLERDTRERLLANARAQWASATLVCATHDISSTLGFDRVVVMAGGRIAEQGAPAGLSSRGGAYARLLEAEAAAARQVWGDAGWRRLRLEKGRVSP